MSSSSGAAGAYGWDPAEVARFFDDERLQRIFNSKNFARALEFTNEVGAIAEEEDHHPLIITEWGRVTTQWWTHVVKGLHKNDFIMAAKSDQLYK